MRKVNSHSYQIFTFCGRSFASLETRTNHGRKLKNIKLSCYHHFLKQDSSSNGLLYNFVTIAASWPQIRSHLALGAIGAIATGIYIFVRGKKRRSASLPKHPQDEPRPEPHELEPKVIMVKDSQIHKFSRQRAKGLPEGKVLRGEELEPRDTQAHEAFTQLREL
jgi:hypothetical protein